MDNIKPLEWVKQDTANLERTVKAECKKEAKEGDGNSCGGLLILPIAEKIDAYEEGAG